MLGLLVSPGRLSAVATEGIVLTVIALGARPLAALLATGGSGSACPSG